MFLSERTATEMYGHGYFNKIWDFPSRIEYVHRFRIRAVEDGGGGVKVSKEQAAERPR